jgi:hypothetical protein
MIPYVRGGKQKVLRMSPYPHVTLAMPGRHGNETTPKHGDFVVMVEDPMLTYGGRDPKGEHQFKHDDIFKDVERRREHSIMTFYLEVIQGGDPTQFLYTASQNVAGCIAPSTFMCAAQCLAVAEHRRYAKYEPQFGGRFLPFRFAAGIDEGLWSAEAAIAVQKKGRPGVEWLEKDFGVPSLTKELMK